MNLEKMTREQLVVRLDELKKENDALKAEKDSFPKRRFPRTCQPTIGFAISSIPHPSA